MSMNADVHAHLQREAARIGALTERARIRRAQAGALRCLSFLARFIGANGDYCEAECDGDKHVADCVLSDWRVSLRKLLAATKPERRGR